MIQNSYFVRKPKRDGNVTVDVTKIGIKYGKKLIMHTVDERDLNC